MTKLNIKCLISGKDTDERIAVFEEIVEPGGGPPRHTHRTQVEVFHIIDGTLRFEIDGETKDVGPGAAAVVPVGAVHAFRNTGTVPARIHFEMIPAGESEEAFSRLIDEADQIVDVGAFFSQYDMDLIGPPLA